jgi:hypothetical protein
MFVGGDFVELFVSHFFGVPRNVNIELVSEGRKSSVCRISAYSLIGGLSHLGQNRVQAAIL